MGERFVRNEEVVGSTPISSTASDPPRAVLGRLRRVAAFLSDVRGPGDVAGRPQEVRGYDAARPPSTREIRMPVPTVRRSTPGVRALTAFVLLLAPLSAQLVGLRIEPDAEKKYKGVLRQRGAERWLVGDAVDGMKVDGVNVKVTHDKFVVMCVADPAKPDAPLYDGEDKDGRKKVAEGRRVVVDRKDFKLTTVWDNVQTLTGLRLEYVRKKAEIDEKRKQLGALKLGTPEWFELQRATLVDVDGLVGWLKTTGFDAAAAIWEKQYGAEIKKAGGAASKTRLEESKRVAKIDVPEGLVESTKAAGKGDQKWHAKSSRHVRMIAHGEVEGGRLDAALVTAERIIEAFRLDFIDPYLGPDDTDPIPEEVFVEYLFCPDEDAFCTHLWEKYYGKQCGEPRDQTTKMNHRGQGGPGFLSLAKNGSGGDLEGWVAHTIGHFLGNRAFNGDQDMPAWCGEGLAYWVSFEHLSRNSVTCFAWSKPEYARKGDPQGEKRVEEGMRAAFTSLALTQGPSMSDLFMTPLASMEPQHLAKAWSVIDWMFEKERPRLRQFLRAACAAHDRGRTQSEKLRPTAMEIFEVKSGDVYVDLEEKWRKFATSTGGEARANKRKP